ncbi:unnamed protein product [Cuscuta epithymum]|uniref:Retrotransposon gag domain-containing protein n=1 Tax=Cuscuta epithymum TaxID=186058 RepID=A0AAV0CDG4_9ASTE|nr:unnamed protein product [Cuscuta epithymum]
MEDKVQGLERQLEEQTLLNEKKFAETNQKLDVFLQLMQKKTVENLEDQSLHQISPVIQSAHGNFQPNSGNHARTPGFLPKIEFPNFSGINPRQWIQKCAKYFELCSIDNNQKVDLASLYLSGRAESWFTSYISVHKKVSWEQFVVDICARFNEELGSTVTEEFNRLQQFRSLDEYMDQFEQLRSLLLQRTERLPEEFFLDRFIGGLNPTIKSFVKAFKPRTLMQTMEYARLQENSLDALKKWGRGEGDKPVYRNIEKPTLPPYRSVVSQNAKGLLPKPITQVGEKKGLHNQVRRNLSARDIEERRRNNLCFYCDEGYYPGHKCSAQIYKLQIISIDGEKAFDLTEEEDEDLEENQHDELVGSSNSDWSVKKKMWSE